MVVNFFRYLTLSFLLFLFGVTAYAEDGDIDYTNVTSSGVELSWEGSSDIFFYKINYGTTSGEEKDNYTELLDSTNFTFDDLSENTTYYFTVLGYNELGNEGYKTNELEITTSSEEFENKNAFYLEDANMVGKTEIELTFSNALEDDGSEKEFAIENINDSSDYYDVIYSKVSHISDNRLIITLDRQPIVGEEYSVVVLAITDKYNQTIENGVDIDATFIGLDIEDNYVVELNSAEEEEDGEEGSIHDESTDEGAKSLLESLETEVENDLNSANDEEVIKNNEEVEEDIDSELVGGVDLNSADVENNVLNVAEDNSNLPKTGPEQLLIFVLAIILSALIFVFRLKKA